MKNLVIQGYEDFLMQFALMGFIFIPVIIIGLIVKAIA